MWHVQMHGFAAHQLLDVSDVGPVPLHRLLGPPVPRLEHPHRLRQRRLPARLQRFRLLDLRSVCFVETRGQVVHLHLGSESERMLLKGIESLVLQLVEDFRCLVPRRRRALHLVDPRLQSDLGVCELDGRRASVDPSRELIHCARLRFCVKGDFDVVELGLLRLQPLVVLLKLLRRVRLKGFHFFRHRRLVAARLQRQRRQRLLRRLEVDFGLETLGGLVALLFALLQILAQLPDQLHLRVLLLAH